MANLRDSRCIKGTLIARHAMSGSVCPSANGARSQFGIMRRLSRRWAGSGVGLVSSVR